MVHASGWRTVALYLTLLCKNHLKLLQNTSFLCKYSEPPALPLPLLLCTTHSHPITTVSTAGNAPLLALLGCSSLPMLAVPSCPSASLPASIPAQDHGNGHDVSCTSRVIRLHGLRKFLLEQKWI